MRAARDDVRALAAALVVRPGRPRRPPLLDVVLAAAFALIDDWLELFIEAGIEVEDDESGEEGLYCFSCDAPTEDVLRAVQARLPPGFVAEVVPVPPLSFAGAEILIRRE